MSDGIRDPLIVAAISAITYVAYRHPKPFAKIYGWFGKALTLAVFLLFGFYYGARYGAYLAAPHLGADAPKKLQLILASIDASASSIAWPIVGIAVYAMFLLSLPYLLGLREQDSIEKKVDEERP